MPTYVLSVPPSVNRMFVNTRKTVSSSGRRLPGRLKASCYRAWIAGELKALLAQRAKPVPGEVAIKLVFPARGKADLDSRIKASIDLLKRAGIIEDDGPKFVRALTAEFDDIEGMKISIEPYIQPARAA